MIIIKPDAITPSILTASNVPETDYATWSAGTYYAGDRVIYAHNIYEAITTTTAQPDVGVSANPPTWIYVSADNRYKMFDNGVGTQTVQNGTITATITPNTPYNAVALFGLEAATARLVVKDSGSVTVYDETVTLTDYSEVTNYYTYFFAPLSSTSISEVAFLDVPYYGNATYELTIDAGTGDAKCGEAVFGTQSSLSVANFGSSIGIKDYSVKTVDDFGNITITQRAYSKRADFDLTIETSLVGAFAKQMADIRATPVVYIGDPNRQETIIYGYYKDFSVVLSNPSISSCSLTVEGLV